MRLGQLAATALGTTLLALVPGGAGAQDAATFDWSGPYVGLSLGAMQSGGTVDFSFPAPGEASTGSGYEFSGDDLLLNGLVEDSGLPQSFSLGRINGLAGANAGYNFQHQNFVFGLEGDFSLLTPGSASASTTTPSGETTVEATTSLGSLATLRGRAGIAVDRLLLFATAGIAAGQTSLSTDFAYADGGKSAAASGSASGLALGVVGGAGVEYALTDALSLKAEGLYYHLNGPSATATGSGTNSAVPPANLETFQPYAASSSHGGVVVRTGINLRF